MATLNDLTNALNDLKASQDSIMASIKEAHAVDVSALRAQADADAKALEAAIAQITQLKSELVAMLPATSAAAQ